MIFHNVKYILNCVWSCQVFVSSFGYKLKKYTPFYLDQCSTDLFYWGNHFLNGVCLLYFLHDKNHKTTIMFDRIRHGLRLP